MSRRGLGIATASLTACAFLGSLGCVQVALGSEVSCSVTGSLVSAASDVPAIPSQPTHEEPREPRGGNAVFMAGEALKSQGSGSSVKMLSATGDAYGSGSSDASGTIAVDGLLALRTSLIRVQAARAPPSA